MGKVGAMTTTVFSPPYFPILLLYRKDKCLSDMGAVSDPISPSFLAGPWTESDVP